MLPALIKVLPVNASMPKSTFITSCYAQFRYLVPIHPGDRRNDHLRNPVSTLNLNANITVVYQYYLDLATIIRINGAWAVYQ